MRAMARPCRLAFLVFVLNTCTCGPDHGGNDDSRAAATLPPWSTGSFAGTCSGQDPDARFEIGTGSVQIHADGTFDLRFVWAEGSLGSRPAELWVLGGTWAPAEPPSPAGDPDTIRLDLFVTSANFDPLLTCRPRATVTRADISIGFGPCTGFGLPRVQ